MNSREALNHPVVVASMKICRELREAALPAFGDLKDQIERSALSVGSNWMEGIGRRGTTRGPQQYYRQARGSGYELAFQATIAGLDTLADEAHAMCDLMEPEIIEDLTA